MTNGVPPVVLPIPEIRNREEFLHVLARTSAEMDNLVARERAYPVWALLQRQLHSMQEWTANGASLTEFQRGKVSIGLVAARELEPAPDAAMEDLVTRLHLLNYYWRHWPEAHSPSPPAPPVIATESFSKTKKVWSFSSFRMPVPVLISLLLFVIACALPALEFKNSDKPNDVMLGLRALAVGWSGIFAAIIAWYANPFWLASLVLAYLRRPVLATVLGIIAVTLAATTISIVGRELPGDEGNVTKTTVIRLLPGFYVWIASIGILPLTAFWRARI
jgi:hypothetical protein